MKKQTLLLMAGGLMALASCNNNAGEATGASQAQIDSMVNARVEEIRTQMMASNDSLINAMAAMKADSIIAAMKNTGGTITKTTKTVIKPSAPTNVTPAQKAPANTNPIKSHSDQNSSGGLKNIKDHSDQSQQQSGQSGLKGIKSHADKKPGQ